MKVYLSGKITGQSQKVTEVNFRVAEIRLKKQGFEVCNPYTELADRIDLQLIKDEAEQWTAYMKAAITLMMACDSIYMLNDWLDSSGAVAEEIIANFINMPVSYECDEN